MQSRHLSYARATHQRLFHDPPLLLHRAPTPTTLSPADNHLRIHSDVLIHTAIVYLHTQNVHTVGTKRLLWLGTGSKTTKRGAEHRWPSTLRCGGRQGSPLRSDERAEDARP